MTHYRQYTAGQWAGVILAAAILAAGIFGLLVAFDDGFVKLLMEKPI